MCVITNIGIALPESVIALTLSWLGNESNAERDMGVLFLRKI
jgi:hypothetical protein